MDRAGAHEWFTVSWLGDFVQSPGFGGLAAVVAATVAYWSSRRGDAERQRTAERDRWWDQAKWALDRLDNPGTQDGALAALISLLNRAADDTEKAFVSAAVFPGLDQDLEGVDQEPLQEAHLDQRFEEDR